MRTQCAVAIIAVVVLFSVLMVVPTVMSIPDEDYRYFRFTGNVTELWNQSHEGASWTSASGVRDVDGDAKEDVLVFTSVNNEATNTTTETVIAKRGYDGTHLWEENVTVGPSGGGIDAYPAGDLYGDGKEDVLVQMTEYNETTNTTTKTVIAKLGCNGTPLWEENETLKGLNLWLFDDALPAGDLDGDGKDDVLVQMSEYNDTIQTWTGTVIAKCGCNGTHLWEESATGSISAAEAGDLDGDGKEDVLVEMSEYSSTYLYISPAC